MTPVSMKALLEAGAHFGHQTRRWDPRMKPFIFTQRNGIHIIDLQQTVRRLEEACEWVSETVSNGGMIDMDKQTVTDTGGLSAKSAAEMNMQPNLLSKMSLGAGEKVAMLVGAGALQATDEVIEVADILGAGVAKALLGKAVIPDDLPFCTGPIGLLGSKPSWDMMEECDTLLIVGSSCIPFA